MFDTSSQCAEFSLTLLSVFNKTDWRALGLPGATTALGIAAGACFPGYNPVSMKCVNSAEGEPFFFGSHVCRAARIKAVAPPGQAWCSEQFVTALVVDCVNNGTNESQFFFQYLGQRDLAKAYDRCPLYRLCRPSDLREHVNLTTDAQGQLIHNDSLQDEQDEENEALTDAAAAAADAQASDDANAADGEDEFEDDDPSAVAAAAVTGGSTVNGAAPLSQDQQDIAIVAQVPLVSQSIISRGKASMIQQLAEYYLSLDSAQDADLGAWVDIRLLHSLIARLVDLGSTSQAFAVVSKALASDSPHKGDLRLQYLRVLTLRNSNKADEFMSQVLTELEKSSTNNSNTNGGNNPDVADSAATATDSESNGKRNSITNKTSSSGESANDRKELRAKIYSLSGRLAKDKYFECMRQLKSEQDKHAASLVKQQTLAAQAKTRHQRTMCCCRITTASQCK